MPKLSEKIKAHIPGNSRGKDNRQRQETLESHSHFDEPSNKIWSIYVDEAEKYDEELADSWKVDTDGTLIFAGLFSAVVTTFLASSIQLLQQNSSDTITALLTQISGQLSPSNSGTTSGQLSNGANSFQATTLAVWTNALWVMSLILSLTSAMLSTLIQQWSRDYIKSVGRHPVPHKRGRIRAFLFEGVEAFGLKTVVNAVPLLLQIAVFLFLVGLITFLFPINVAIANIALSMTATLVALYFFATWLPALSHQCPFRTPLSGVVWQFLHKVHHLLPSGLLAGLHAIIAKITSQALDHFDVTPYKHDSMRRGREHFATVVDRPHRVSQHLTALQWTVESLSDDAELDPFIDGIPGFLGSSKETDSMIIIHVLLKGEFGRRFHQMFSTFDRHSGAGLGYDDRMAKRAMSYMQVMRSMAGTELPWAQSFCRETAAWDETHTSEYYSLMNTLSCLKAEEASPFAFNATSTAIFVACRLIHELMHPEIDFAFKQLVSRGADGLKDDAWIEPSLSKKRRLVSLRHLFQEQALDFLEDEPLNNVLVRHHASVYNGRVIDDRVISQNRGPTSCKTLENLQTYIQEGTPTIASDVEDIKTLLQPLHVTMLSTLMSLEPDAFASDPILAGDTAEMLFAHLASHANVPPLTIATILLDPVVSIPPQHLSKVVVDSIYGALSRSDLSTVHEHASDILQQFITKSDHGADNLEIAQYIFNMLPLQRSASPLPYNLEALPERPTMHVQGPSDDDVSPINPISQAPRPLPRRPWRSSTADTFLSKDAAAAEKRHLEVSGIRLSSETSRSEQPKRKKDRPHSSASMEFDEAAETQV